MHKQVREFPNDESALALADSSSRIKQYHKTKSISPDANDRLPMLLASHLVHRTSPHISHRTTYCACPDVKLACGSCTTVTSLKTMTRARYRLPPRPSRPPTAGCTTHDDVCGLPDARATIATFCASSALPDYDSASDPEHACPSIRIRAHRLHRTRQVSPSHWQPPRARRRPDPPLLALRAAVIMIARRATRAAFSSEVDSGL